MIMNTSQHTAFQNLSKCTGGGFKLGSFNY
jgi:hypothetical protein